MANSSIHIDIKTQSFPHSPTTQTSSTQPITRSDPNNPYPTTFVQADTSTFKQVVQMLTGKSQKGSDPIPTRTHPIPPIKLKQSFKLYERRNSFKNFKINPLLPGLKSAPLFNMSPRKHETLSPSILDFPSLALSPVTPLIPDPFTRPSSSYLNDAEIDSRAIAEKGFYLHKSPATTPRDSEPKLLPLFPVTSPRLLNDAV